MSAPQQPIDLGVLPSETTPLAEPAVLPAGPRRPFSPRGWARDLVADHRLIPVLAALAGVAATASFVAEWQVTSVDPAALDIEQPTGRLLTADLSDLGALGGGYVVGVLALAAALVVVLFGPAAIRRLARLAGLGVAGATLAVVAGMGASLGRQSRSLPGLYNMAFDNKQMHVSDGRGIWCAAFAVLLAAVALLLADRAAAPVVPRQPFGSGLPLELSVGSDADESGREGISG